MNDWATQNLVEALVIVATPSRGIIWWTDRLTVEDACWVWNGKQDGNGYGSVKVDGQSRAVHRFIYEACRGPVDRALTLDHLCRNRRCANPAHLEPVTPAENVLRGEGIAALNARKTHCKRGHEFTPENTYVYRRSNGRGSYRACRTCVLASQTRRRYQAKAAA